MSVLMKAKTLFFLSASASVLFSLSSEASQVIYAECGKQIKVTLSVSNKEVLARDSPSGNNYASLLDVNGSKKKGYTAIYYGGMSRDFFGYDGTTKFESTIGFGSSQHLRLIQLSTKSGTYSCIAR